MEAMANGCAILATAVGDIPLHVKTPENGFVFTETMNEEKIVAEGQAFIAAMNADRETLAIICHNNMAYAKREYSIEHFKQEYSKVVFGS